MMALSNSGEGSIVIAIDKDKNSQNAVKWAVDNLLNNKNNNSSCILIHVTTISLQPKNDSQVQPICKDGRPPTEQELHQFFLSYRGFCARKGIAAKELVLHDIDVPSALTSYIIDNSITNIVVGSSHGNIFKRKFKDADVAAKLAKSLPESCTVHVVSKTKVQSIQPQPRSAKDSSFVEATKSTMKCSSPSPELISCRSPFKLSNWRGGSKSFGKNHLNALEGAPHHRNPNSNVQEYTHSSYESCSLSQSSSNYLSIPHYTSNNSSPHVSQFTHDTSHEHQDGIDHSDDSLRNMEMKIQRLKHELRQRSMRYSTASKATISAEHRSMELEKLRKDEGDTRNCRLAEEERLKSKAALASAEVSKLQKKMEMMHSRRHEERRAMRKEQQTDQRVSDYSVHISNRLSRYNIQEIQAATNYFDDSLKLGEGGYGPVYKGVLNHTVVAIKVLRPDITQGEKQFQKEVDVLSTLRHPNMVLLLGACPEFGCLVYEYMEYGSLDDRLFQKDNTPPIPWSIRFRIASEISLALDFLHQTKPEPLVHRDLKPANILLDRIYVSKISDVGLARLVPPSVSNKTTQYHLTAAAGTFCYIDPEYQQTGLLGVKSDLYSLGIMLLQIITAKPPMGLAHTVEKAINKGKFKELLDPSVTGWPVEGALSLARLALKCCEMRKKDRPNLRSVVLPELNRLRDLAESYETDTSSDIYYSLNM